MEDQLFPSAPPVARAVLRGTVSHPELMGEVLFSPYGTGTLVTIRAVGLPPSTFLGFHIHDKGDCSSEGDVPFSSAGGHYNPGDMSHPFHAGDLPSLLSAANGTAFLSVYTDRFRPQGVVGRAVILHEMADDLHSQPAGNSGARIACGVIQAI